MTLASAATRTAAMSTTVTDWSYIAWACAASSPASTISAVKTSAPTTATPTARMSSPTADEMRAASAMRTAIAATHQPAGSRRAARYPTPRTVAT